MAFSGYAGSVRSTKPSWMREPPTDCWPTVAIIWQMLSTEPLEPHVAMMRGELLLDSSSMHMEPIESRSLDRMPLSTDSSDCSSLQPGSSDRRPALYSLMRPSACR